MGLKYLSTVVVLATALTLTAQNLPLRQIPIDQGWLFNPTDDPSFSGIRVDEKNWKPISVEKDWDSQGHKGLIGFAWYRLKFVLPKALRNEDKLKEGMFLVVGKVDDGDQVFLNGEFVGQNGKTFNPGSKPPADFRTGQWQLERIYKLAMNDPRLKWGSENVLAVRVANPSGPGGMYGGGQHIRVVGMSNILDFQAQSAPFTFYGSELVKKFDLLNTSSKFSVQGTLNIDVVGIMSGKKIINNTRTIDIAPGEKMPINVQLGIKDEACKISYHIAFKDGDSYEFKEESPYILTPPVSNMPKINGATTFGARPGKPFMFTVPVSGERPMTITASGLPKSLAINSQTGIITGITPALGTYKILIKATNARGEATRELEIISGDRLALTPPMGWNSWNCWGLSVDEEKVVASARTFVEKGLRDHGWSYINIDDGWEIVGSSPDPKRDSDGNILVNNKFPNMKRLGDRLHDLGLKFGIYSSPGPLTCGGYTGSYEYEQNDANSYAEWGVDYLKYDWCSYGRVAKDSSLAELKKPYEVMRDALGKVNRDIVLSLCQYGMGKVWEWGDSVGGQLWRTTYDITDTWNSMSTIGFSQVENAPFAKPGAWNDPDMLVLGWVGWGPNLHPTRLTPDEQYTHMSLWCLLSAPLLLGCDLTRLDPFTLNLLTNDEVLAINQDKMGRQATQKVIDGSIQVWVKELHDGGKAIGIFNLGETTTEYEVNLESIGIAGNKTIRDIWRQRDLSQLQSKHRTRIAPHGVTLLKVI
ncbi:MAG: putative Ig domain-containing protein [Holophagaceae bacterium]|nr:putative Ig domain-containing protein [Holophagaceae bacterium]